ncbi:MAG: class I SAM-dependent methyltransferase [Planctomycetota bacterium]|nr:class I SAM-dependent methyltransferase [Planctomycetota bacterium]
MEILSKEQREQEDDYVFPYHYIPSLAGGDFSSVRVHRWGYQYMAYLEFVIEKISGMDFGSLLDVGCGDGRLLHELKLRFGDKRLAGLDMSEQALRFAGAFNPGIQFICGDITDPAVMEGKFDVITLIETLEHIKPSDVPTFVEALAGRLADDGVIVITVPSRNIRPTRKHYQHFDLESLRQTVRPHLVVAEHFFLNKSSFADKVLRRLLVNKLFILNNRRLRNLIYRTYRRFLLNAREGNAGRICILCRKSESL